MKCKDCPYWYSNFGPDGTPTDEPSCKYPYDDGYAPCEVDDQPSDHSLNPSPDIYTHHVTITQTRVLTIPVPETDASTPEQALALVAQEYSDNRTNLSDDDWHIVNLQMQVDHIAH